jgi:hypothetical protein
LRSARSARAKTPTAFRGYLVPTVSALRKSGALANRLHYVGIGTKLRVALGVKYAKFQIGRRPVFPTQGQPLPQEYVRTLQRIAVDVVRKELGR